MKGGPGWMTSWQERGIVVKSRRRRRERSRDSWLVRRPSRDWRDSGSVVQSVLATTGGGWYAWMVGSLLPLSPPTPPFLLPPKKITRPPTVGGRQKGEHTKRQEPINKFNGRGDGRATLGALIDDDLPSSLSLSLRRHWHPTFPHGRLFALLVRQVGYLVQITTTCK